MKQMSLWIVGIILYNICFVAAPIPVVHAENQVTVTSTPESVIQATSNVNTPTPSSINQNVTQIPLSETQTPTPLNTAESTVVNEIDSVEKITATADSEATTNNLGPVIFVPGIMGSYLDYKNPNDNDKVCNIWPTAQTITSSGRCKHVSSLTQPQMQEWHRDVLMQLDNERVYATDVIRSQGHTTSLGDAYITLMNKLNDTWPEYRGDNSLFAKKSIDRCNAIKEKVNRNEINRNQTLLYAFGYDWRQTTKYNAAKLSEFIDCVRSTHNNAKASLVGHSMGGLVIKQLLLNYNDSSSIANVSTFNTPYLGAVRAIQIMGNGEYGWISTLILGSAYLKEVAKSVPGAIELLPSNLYLKRHPCRFAIENQLKCTIDDHWATITSQFSSMAGNSQYRLSDDVGKDNEGAIIDRTSTINYLIQFSPNKISSKNTTVSFVNKKGTKWLTESGMGDGTVNEFSLTRRLSDIDYNPQSTVNRKVYIYGYCDKKIDHTAIVSNNDAITRLIDFLQDPAKLDGIPQNTCINGDSVNLSNLNTPSTLLNQPDDGYSSINGLWPTLMWQDNNNNVQKKGYRIQVSVNSDMSNPVVDECTTNKNYKPTSNLWAQSMVGTYYWRVNYMPVSWTASNPSSCKSNESVTGWSSIRSFVNPIIDKRPQLMSPVENFSSTDGFWVPLTWTPSSITPTYGYRIQVSTDNTFQDMTKMVVNECRMSSPYTAISPAWTKTKIGIYYWRVNYATKTWATQNSQSCKNDAVVDSLWSSVRSFRNGMPSSIINYTYSLNWSEQNFYQHIFALGDVNGDTFADMGTYDDSGLVRVWFGRRTGLASMASQSETFTVGQGSLIPLCDVNNDKYSDVMVSNSSGGWFVPGSASGLRFQSKVKLNNGGWGTHVQIANKCFGDVTGDGKSDLVMIGDNQIQVISGGTNFPNVVSSTSQICTMAVHKTGKCNIGVAGDVNGDGINDIVIHRVESGKRRLELYLGKTSNIFGVAPKSIITGPANYSNEYFASSFGSVGDVNLDGFDDLGVAQYWNGVMLFKGSATGYSTIYDWMVTGFDAGIVASAGDVNDDGYDDLYVGSPWQAKARIFLGNKTTLENTPAWLESGSGHFGWPGGDAGDIDGNGKNDIFVGAHYYNGVEKVFLFK